ncbi:hypothetical protein [Stenotrophomonas maltophilia]|uniref:hypothetical protein n=1 Tax=Stenotrophomonas maltophilia TaxID=40324 RepID=UPI0013DC93E5|nr:hypothetical protein [Stenotrophomonas maltophilia]
MIIALQILILLWSSALTWYFLRKVKASSKSNLTDGRAATQLWTAGISLGALFFYLPGLFIVGLTEAFNKPVFKGLPGLVDIDLGQHATAILFFCTLVSCIPIAVIATRSGSPLGRFRDKSNLLVRYSLAIAAIYFSAFAWDVITHGILSGDAHWAKSRDESMTTESGSTFNIALLYVKNSARILYFSSLFALWRNKKFRTPAFCAIWFASLAFDVYLSGNRFIIAASGMLFAFYLLRDGRWAWIATGLAVFPPIAWFATVFMRARGRLYSLDGSQSVTSFLADVSRESSTTTLEYISNTFEGINFNTFVSIFYDAPNRIAFLYGETFAKAFIFWIPRSVWNDKTVRVGQIIGEAYAGDPALSIVATLPGEAWLNFGYAAVIAIPILIWIASKLMPLLVSALPRDIGICACFFFAFSLCRASYSALVIDSIVTFFLCTILVLACQRKVEVFGLTVPIAR